MHRYVQGTFWSAVVAESTVMQQLPYMRKGFLIYEVMRKYFPIYEVRRPLVIYDFATDPF
jgi:hypothetical protein